MFKYFLLLIATLTIGLHAAARGPDSGFIEVGTHVLHNIPAYTDQSGEEQDVYVDSELRWKLLPNADLMIGFDAHMSEGHFVRAAGKAELAYHVIGPFTVFFWHRSDHNLDYRARRLRVRTLPQPKARYNNDNRVGIRYQWQ